MVMGQLLDFPHRHGTRLGIAEHGVGRNAGGHGLVVIGLHPHTLNEGLGAPLLGGLGNFFDGVQVVAAVGTDKPARRHERRGLHLAAGNTHQATATLGAGLEITHLLFSANTQTHHAVGRHEDPVLDFSVADFHGVEQVLIMCHEYSSKAWCRPPGSG